MKYELLFATPECFFSMEAIPYLIVTGIVFGSIGYVIFRHGGPYPGWKEEQPEKNYLISKFLLPFCVFIACFSFYPWSYPSDNELASVEGNFIFAGRRGPGKSPSFTIGIATDQGERRFSVLSPCFTQRKTATLKEGDPVKVLTHDGYAYGLFSGEKVLYTYDECRVNRQDEAFYNGVFFVLLSIYPAYVLIKGREKFKEKVVDQPQSSSD